MAGALLFSFGSPLTTAAAGQPHAPQRPSAPGGLQVEDRAPRPADPYAEELVARALAMRLHEHPYWRALLHFERGWFGDRSLIDDPRFFADPNGKFDAEAELAATIRSFFEPTREGAGSEIDRPATVDTKAPICRFAARFDWLVEQLGIETERLPVARCEAVETLVESIAPRTVTVSFPAAHMNSPASMYGHTLLVIDTARESRLLAYAINYAGMADTSFGPLYAVKGIFGFYKGVYTILPYYAKLQEYSDVNDRDIWEYELDLDATEIRRLILHVYELEGIESDYYFFDENCSYNLLFLLDVARPGLDLTGRMGLWVIPLDTIRAIDDAGLVRRRIYRPSKSTQIENIASVLEPEQRDLAVAVASGRVEPEEIASLEASPTARARTADLATEFLQYRYLNKELDQASYAPVFRDLLEVRSRLGGPELGAPAPPDPAPPESGHRSSRLGVGAGEVGDESFTALHYRPVYHDLLDNPRGYDLGSEIVFGELRLRYYDESEKIELERLRLIDIVSYAPRNGFFAPTSWKVDTGLVRRRMLDGRRRLVWALDQGLGLAYALGSAALWHSTVDLDLQFGSGLKRNHAVGLGVTTGLLVRASDRWQVHGEAVARHYGLGDPDRVLGLRVVQNIALTTNLAVRGRFARVHERDHWWAEWSVRLHVHF